MAEYIEREALLNSLRDSYAELRKIQEKLHYDEEKQICSAELTTFVECILRVKNAPSADVAEVRHGEWDNCLCSVCGNVNPTLYMDADNEYRAKATPYCPYCGAKMDGKEGAGE